MIDKIDSSTFDSSPSFPQNPSELSNDTDYPVPEMPGMPGFPPPPGSELPSNNAAHEDPIEKENKLSNDQENLNI